MTSKSLFFKLMKEDLKRRLWAVALIGLGCFFIFPVTAAFMASLIEDYKTYEKGLAVYTENLAVVISFSDGAIAFGMMAASLICGLSSFSYLNNRSKVDFYHGIPVRREKLYAANYLNGILILAVPYGICLALAVVIGISNGVKGSVLWPAALTAFGLNLIYFALMYTTVVIAAMMTGNLVVGFLGCMVFAFVIPLAVSLIRSYYMVFYKTYVSDISSPLFRWGVRMSPVMEYMFQIDNYAKGGNMLPPAFGALAVVLVLALLGCFLYRKRPSEAAGKAMAFAVSRPIIRIVMTMVSALGMVLFFWGVRGSMGWAVFGLICGAVICHCVMEIIYHFDFKKLFCNKLQLAGCIVVSLAVLCVFRFDLTGYDTYLPKSSDVKSVAVDVSRLDNWVSYGKLTREKDGAWVWEDMTSGRYVFGHMQYQDVENLLEIAKEGIRQVEEKRKTDSRVIYDEEPAAEEMAAVYSEIHADGPTSVFVAGRLAEDTKGEPVENWSEVAVCYTLNSGRKVYRTYHLDLEKVLPQAERMMADQQYLQGAFPLMTRTADQVAVVSYREGKTEKVLDALTGEEKQELLSAWQKEFAALTITDMHEQAPVGLIRFNSEDEETAMKWMKAMEDGGYDRDPYYNRRIGYIGYDRYYSGYYGDAENRDYYPVYPSFTETLALLKKHQIDAGDYFKNQKVVSVRVGGESLTEDGNDGMVYTIFTDDKEIAGLMDVLADSRRLYYNRFYLQGNMDVTLTVAQGERTDELNAAFPRGKVPAFVLKRLYESD